MNDIKKKVWEQVLEARKKYVIPADQEMPPFNRQKEMVACSLLIEVMEEKGASNDELMNVLTYCAIVLDAEKMRLNALQAYDDYQIDALCEKYITTSTEEMNNEK